MWQNMPCRHQGTVHWIRFYLKVGHFVYSGYFCINSNFLQYHIKIAFTLIPEFSGIPLNSTYESSTSRHVPRSQPW